MQKIALRQSTIEAIRACRQTADLPGPHPPTLKMLLFSPQSYRNYLRISKLIFLPMHESVAKSTDFSHFPAPKCAISSKNGQISGLFEGRKISPVNSERLAAPQVLKPHRVRRFPLRGRRIPGVRSRGCDRPHRRGWTASGPARRRVRPGSSPRRARRRWFPDAAAAAWRPAPAPGGCLSLIHI